MRIKHVSISACLYHSRERGLEVIDNQNGFVLEFGFDPGGYSIYPWVGRCGAPLIP